MSPLSEKFQFLFKLAQYNGQNSVADQVIEGCEEEGPYNTGNALTSLHEGLSGPDNLLKSNDSCKGGILYQSKDLIGDRRKNTLDHLQQLNMKENL